MLLIIILNVIAIVIAFIPVGIVFEDYNKSYYSSRTRFDAPWFYIRFKNRLLNANFPKKDLKPFNYLGRILANVIMVNIFVAIYYIYIK
ncbi:MAG: hypothetical protein NTZ97_02045 [Candidatus Moranbacteria bacterium]|nr:hypothetical protein [Candidatus Moranbacteria bacterium]